MTDATPAITFTALENGGRYTIRVPEIDGEGIISYVHETPTHVVVNTTRVDASLQGRGLAGLLAARLATDALAKGWTTDPQCSYFAAQLDKHPEWAALRRRVRSAGETAETVLSFWFEEIPPEAKFKRDAAFDAQLTARFGRTLEQAAAGELFAWRETARGRLAEIIVLDQFSRNIYRDTPRAFAQDAMALALAQEAVGAGALEVLDSDGRMFLLMPYMHSESRAIHALAAPLFEKHTSAGTYDYELRHKKIVDAFGRYPHRNAILGRASTTEELTFLTQPGSSF